ncbi:MAG: DUF624 domain-containing protein [Clostridia bacterium]|nr:DUF624 domain-containing protein [Clostridia bacterium]
MEKQKKFKIPNIFDMNRDGKGVDPGEDTTPNLSYFFKLIFRKFSNLITLNLMMFAMVLPIAIAVYVFFNGPQMPTMSSPAYSALMGAQLAGAGGSELLTKLMHILPQVNFITYNSYASWLPYVLIAVLAITWGWQNTGVTYILRGLVRGDGVFMFSDYFYAIKKNFKQGLILGLMDAGIIIVLIIDFMYTWSARSNYWSYLMFFAVTALIIVYLFMRMYIYLMMITFNISLYKMLKNALIFTALGIKRNLMAGLGILLCIALWAALAFIGLQYNLGFLIFIPALIMFALIAFISVYCAYPVIKKHMIDPITVATESNDE